MNVFQGQLLNYIVMPVRKCTFVWSYCNTNGPHVLFSDWRRYVQRQDATQINTEEIVSDTTMLAVQPTDCAAAIHCQPVTHPSWHAGI